MVDTIVNYSAEKAAGFKILFSPVIRNHSKR